MFGIIFAATSSLLQEISVSIGKYEIRNGAASIYTYGFLSLLFGSIFFFAEGILRHSFVFSLDSLPTFVPRLALEILQAHVTVRAIAIADRGDFGFVRMLTIPLLLGADTFLGYVIPPLQTVGLALTVTSVLVLLVVESNGRSVRGFWYLAFASVNAAVTISLYKYDIAHFNSIAAEQLIVHIVLMLYFFAAALMIARENPLRFLTRKAFLGQSIASGLSNVVGAFAYAYAPASIITAAARAFAVLFAVVSGRLYFREAHFLARGLLLVSLLAGLVLIALP